MPDLDLLQITHHTCTAVSSTLPGIIFKIPGQDRSPTTKCLEHSQSHSTESVWHTNSESKLYLVLGSTRHQTNGILLPLSLSLSGYIYIYIYLPLSLIYKIIYEIKYDVFPKKYGCSDFMGPGSVGKLCGRQHKLHLGLFSGMVVHMESIGCH